MYKVKLLFFYRHTLYIAVNSILLRSIEKDLISKWALMYVNENSE